MRNLKDFQRDTESQLSNAVDFFQDEYDQHPDLVKVLGGAIIGIAIGAIAVMLFSRKNLADRRKTVTNSPRGF